ncbi:hypothetical protein LTR47_002639 [Exophiala xenobiotica]|nr:hypothetical protein LTR47_002639 [Exophiala xenobiotica]KAK5418866.1 hypothetical protein LTR06_002617 [Exophiala xenobiotica]
MSLGKKFKLNSGYEIPAVGLGTWLSEPNEVASAVQHALRVGYRHIDAAAIYQNEHEVGQGWKSSGVPREEIFIHWPVSFVYREGELFPKESATGLLQHSHVPIKDTWEAMERLVSAGKVKSIGVSNFTIDKVEELLKTAKIPPAVNQIEAHPWLQQPKLFDYLKSKVLV